MVGGVIEEIASKRQASRYICFHSGVPADKGDVRVLTIAPGTIERLPAWSPDGNTIAWLSDGSGEYALHIAPQTGEGTITKIPMPG